MISPPTMAPGRLPKPPTTAAGKAFGPMKPMLAWTKVMGASRMPATAATAAVVGGFGSLPGAIVGGLIIGVVESLSGFYLPAGFKDVAAYVVVLIMLMLRPNGLFGEKLRKKV